SSAPRATSWSASESPASTSCPSSRRTFPTWATWRTSWLRWRHRPVPTRSRRPTQSRRPTRSRPPTRQTTPRARRPMSERVDLPLDDEGLIRLQKLLALAGVASRRRSEELMLDGEVEVNGEVVTRLGTKVDPASDVIRVSGRRLPPISEKVYLALNK